MDHAQTTLVSTRNTSLTHTLDAGKRRRAELLYAAAVPAVIEIVSDIDAAPSVVFDLALDVDVHAASLHRSQETSTTSTGLRRLALGDEVTCRARHFGLRWQMTSRITVYECPHHFVDEQTAGPLRALRHEHVVAQLLRAAEDLTWCPPARCIGVSSAG